MDKANVLASTAFFRKVFNERAAHHPKIETECMYVDAASLNLVRAPWRFDVLVTENMLGDILLETAIHQGYAEGRIRAAEYGGPDGTRAVGKRVAELVRDA